MTSLNLMCAPAVTTHINISVDPHTVRRGGCLRESGVVQKREAAPFFAKRAGLHV